MDTIDRIFNLMNETSTTSYRIEKDIGIPSGLISQWKARKQNPSLKNLKKLAKYFEVPLDYFVEENNPEEELTLEDAFKNYREEALTKLFSPESVNCAMQVEKLSYAGKRKVIEYINDLYGNPEYRADKNNS